MSEHGPPYDVICFDCDSTLSAVEGIDELARRAGVYDQVAPLTSAAMDGRMRLDEVYAQRIKILDLTRADIDWLARYYIEALVPGACETMAVLQSLRKPVHIVSGGLMEAIWPLADFLSVPRKRVHAVPLLWSSNNRCLGHDTSSPLVQAGGKAVVCAGLTAGGLKGVLIGDGSTDLEATAAGVYVIGFGGVVRRESVAERANAFVSGPQLSDVLPLLLTADEQARAHPTPVKS